MTRGNGMTPTVRSLEQSFEHLGQIREHLTALEILAGDIDDDDFSRAINDAKRANTLALHRNTNLRHYLQNASPDDADLDSPHVAGARGG